MRATKAMIAYTPTFWLDGPKSKTRGQVQIGPLLNAGDADWTKPYAFTVGAKDIARRHYPPDRSRAALFIDFHTMVVRDGIDPQVAHRAFLLIDEYRNAISPDTKGASE